MSASSSAFGRWYPTGTQSQWRTPNPGDLVALNHAVWRVISIEPRLEDLWDDQDRKVVETRGPQAAPVMIVLRPAKISLDDPKARNHDKHFRTYPTVIRWDLYPDEHYPVCATCSEPLPCREKLGQRIAEQALRQMSYYEMAGVCPACEEPVTSRQKSLTFPDNLEVIGGPPVTFHVGRRGCRYSAAKYERRWVDADPNRRRATLSCIGHVTNHNDGTYDCTALNECPGPVAHHPSYSTCACPDCHARGSFTCHPEPNAKQNGAVA